MASTIGESHGNSEVPSSVFLHHYLSSPSNLIIMANYVKELHTILLELDGKLIVDAILDEGSQIIGI